MQIIYTARGEELSDAMKLYFEEKVNKVSKFLTKTAMIGMEFISEPSHKGDAKDLTIKVKLNYKRHFVEVERQGSDYYAIVDEIDPLFRRQVEKIKEKREEKIPDTPLTEVPEIEE